MGRLQCSPKPVISPNSLLGCLNRHLACLSRLGGVTEDRREDGESRAAQTWGIKTLEAQFPDSTYILTNEPGQHRTLSSAQFPCKYIHRSLAYAEVNGTKPSLLVTPRPKLMRINQLCGYSGRVTGTKWFVPPNVVLPPFWHFDAVFNCVVIVHQLT